jgi:hypothetical protein
MEQLAQAAETGQQPTGEFACSRAAATSLDKSPK